VFDRLLLFPDFCAFLQADEHLEWQELFSRRKEVEIVAEEIDDFLTRFYTTSAMPPLKLPESLQFKTESGIELASSVMISYLPDSHTLLQSEMRFIYNNKTISIDHPSHEIVDGQYRTKIIRNLEFEKAALDVTKPFRAFELGEREVNGMA